MLLDNDGEIMVTQQNYFQGGNIDNIKNAQCINLAFPIQPDHKATFDKAQKIVFEFDSDNLIEELDENNNKKELLISK